jgi:hypothetical protein
MGLADASIGQRDAMPTDDTPNMPEPGTDSRVEDWLGQSADRDAELADRLSEALPADEAEAAFERESSGADEQAARHGESIDPEQGESAYREGSPRDT